MCTQLWLFGMKVDSYFDCSMSQRDCTSPCNQDQGKIKADILSDIQTVIFLKMVAYLKRLNNRQCFFIVSGQLISTLTFQEMSTRTQWIFTDDGKSFYLVNTTGITSNTGYQEPLKVLSVGNSVPVSKVVAYRRHNGKRWTGGRSAKYGWMTVMQVVILSWGGVPKVFIDLCFL